MSIMPAVESLIVNQPPTDAENELLYLPSHVPTPLLHNGMDISKLVTEEARLCEGQAYDLILQIRRVVKTLSAAQSIKAKNSHGQKDSTRAYGKIKSILFLRTSLLKTYHVCRNSLLALQLFGEKVDLNRFPKLTENDLYRKPTVTKRSRGETYNPDGRIWVDGEETGDWNGKAEAGSPSKTRCTNTTSDRILGVPLSRPGFLGSFCIESATQMHRRRRPFTTRKGGMSSYSRSDL